MTKTVTDTQIETRLGVYRVESVLLWRRALAGASVIYIMKPVDIVNGFDLSLKANWLVLEVSLVNADIVGVRPINPTAFIVHVVSPWPWLLRHTFRPGTNSTYTAQLILHHALRDNAKACAALDCGAAAMCPHVRDRLIRLLDRAIRSLNLLKMSKETI